MRLGVIDIPAFYMDFEAYRKRDPDYKSTTRDVYKLLMELREEKVDGIILDLRNNGGGSLHEATMLTDLFIRYQAQWCRFAMPTSRYLATSGPPCVPSTTALFWL